MKNTTLNLRNLRCVVLGGTGFIGINLCNYLIGNVENLTIFSRGKSINSNLQSVDFVFGDFSDKISLQKAVKDADVVFHLINSSTPASSNLDKISDLKENVANTIGLLDVCVEEGVKRVIFVSSGGTIYGVPSKIPTPESHPTNPITSYGISKLSIEKYLHLYEYLYGLEYRVLRVANPFGPYQNDSKNQGVIAAFLRKALCGERIDIWGDGNITRDYIYIDDLVDALVFAALHKGEGRIFNIGSGIGRTLNQIVSSIEEELNFEIKVNFLESRSVDVPVSILDIKYSANELGWVNKTSFENGLKSTISWMKSVLLNGNRPQN